MRPLARFSPFVSLALLLLAVPFPAAARILSYAPLTDRHAIPALQHRMNRHFILMEFSGAGGVPFDCRILCPPLPPSMGQLVLYDSKGEEEPRVLLPRSGEDVLLSMAAVRHDSGGLQILAGTTADLEGDNPEKRHRYLLSVDSGATWKVLPLPQGSTILFASSGDDVGGPIARNRGSQVRIGTSEVPFVFSLAGNPRSVVALRADSTLATLAEFSDSTQLALLGSDRDGSRFLVGGAPIVNGVTQSNGIRILDLDGTLEVVDDSLPGNGVEGWITPAGDVYLEKRLSGQQGLAVYREGTRREVAAPLPAGSSQVFFAVPTFDFEGAWILQRAIGQPTILSRHTPGDVLIEQWRDISAPQVEALHAAASGERLLIQVHRPRPQVDQRIFIDPALAIWEIGSPAPQRYDELFLNEGVSKGFVHLDVDAMSEGATFVFDSAATISLPPPPISSAPGGMDVTQEWGVVRASLAQRLVIPGVGRIAGAFDSLWRTDVIIRSGDEATRVSLRFVPGAGGEGIEASIDLAAGETKLLRDVLATTFAIDDAVGALYLTPEQGTAIAVTSRIYTESLRGSFGMALNAYEVLAASTPRFPVTFAGALQGENFRTNLIAADVSGRGSTGMLSAFDGSGRMGVESQATTPAGGQLQINGLAQPLAVPSYQTGAIVLHPSSGEIVAGMVAIDNRTNDPTFFPPDLPAPYVRTIPVIAHVDGMNGSRFRSDLFLFNAANEPRNVTLSAKRWDVAEQETILNLTLLANESKVIRDVLRTAFGRTGIGRLRFISRAPSGMPDSAGVRVTSRTYTVEPDGGTYGLLIPPLNSFQMAGSGETLEIIGAIGDPKFRTNLSLVETSLSSPEVIGVRIDIVNGDGEVIDSFETAIQTGGGTQLVDLFRARGLGDGPPIANIRISPYGGVIGAFASLIDNGTNDPTYLGAGLLSKD